MPPARRRPLSQDRLRSRGAAGRVRRRVPRCARPRDDATDDPLHGHQRPVLRRLLRLLVLSAALRVLPAAVGGEAQALAHRRRGRRQGRGGAPRRPHPPALARGADPAPRRLRLRPRGADGLGRGLARRLPLRPGRQQPAPRRDRRSGLGRGRTPGDGQAGARTSPMPPATAGAGGDG